MAKSRSVRRIGEVLRRAGKGGLSQTFPDQCGSCVRRRHSLTFSYGLGFLDGCISIISCTNAGTAERNFLTSCARKNFATGPQKTPFHRLSGVAPCETERAG